MSSQLTVVVAGIVLVVAIVVALVIMRRGDSRFTYDTQHGTAPRATEGEGNTAATAFKGRFSILTAGVGAMFAALAVKLWGMQMVSSDYYDKQAKSNQTRTVTTPAVRGRILDRNGVALVQNRPSLAVVAYRDLADDKVLCVILPTCSACRISRCCATSRTIPKARRACIRSRLTCAAPLSPTFRSTPVSFPA